MAIVVSEDERDSIVCRYIDNGWLNQRDQDRIENAQWWDYHGMHNFRIPGHELTEWFDDFYAYIDKGFSERKTPKRIVPRKSKAKSDFTIKPSPINDKESLWQQVILPEPSLRLHDALNVFQKECSEHKFVLQFNNKIAHIVRILCATCGRFIELKENRGMIQEVLKRTVEEMHGTIDGIYFELPKT